jgi:PEP-CTERM motif
MSKPLSTALALLLAVPATTWAAAEVSGRAMLEQFSIQLVDLDLSDGISPSLGFSLTVPGGSAGQATVDYAWYDVGDTRTRSFSQAGSPWLTQSASVASPYGSARSVLSGGGQLDASRLVASGGTLAPPDTVYCSIYYCSLPTAGFAAWLAAPLDGSVNFELSANTALYISAVATLSAVAVDGGTLIYGEDPGTVYRFASQSRAEATLTLSGGSPTGGSGSQLSTDGRSVTATSVYDAGSSTWIDASSRSSQRVMVSFLNASDASMQGIFQAEVSVSGLAVNDAFPLGGVSAVPEPATSAMWLAGIGALVALRRRPQAA